MNDVQVVAYPKPQTPIEALLESFGGQGESIFAGTPLEDVETAFSGWTEAQSGKMYARIPYEIIVK